MPRVARRSPSSWSPLPHSRSSATLARISTASSCLCPTQASRRATSACEPRSSVASTTLMDLLTEALGDALQLIVSGDPELLRIVGLSLGVSGIAALLAGLLGVPLGAALHLSRWPGRRPLVLAVNTGMGLPPVVVGLVVTLLLWRTGPLGALRLLYTPAAMVLAQLVVALPLVAGFTRSALDLLDTDLALALRADGAGDGRVGYELVRASFAQVLVAV